jgi:hypothetical protein
VTLAGSISNLNLALASLSYRGVLNYGGADTLNIAASDGNLNASKNVGAQFVGAP